MTVSVMTVQITKQVSSAQVAKILDRALSRFKAGRVDVLGEWERDIEQARIYLESDVRDSGFDVSNYKPVTGLYKRLEALSVLLCD